MRSLQEHQEHGPAAAEFREVHGPAPGAECPQQHVRIAATVSAAYSDHRRSQRHRAAWNTFLSIQVQAPRAMPPSGEEKPAFSRPRFGDGRSSTLVRGRWPRKGT